ncbi:hypothetical protein BC828DRAFT_390269 [Blastocladiella britannica]|nr:hypothetical protein BC828DRAFT_390269 [Blastocladiella britannica]
MDDLADLVWQSAGVKPAPSTPASVPLSQLAAQQQQQQSQMSPGGFGVPRGPSPAAFGMLSSSPARPMAVTTPLAAPFTPPAVGSPQYSPSSSVTPGRTAGMATGSFGLGAASSPMRAAAVPSSASAASVSSGDPFGGLVSFGGGGSGKLASQLSLAEQMRLKQQQQQQPPMAATGAASRGSAQAKPSSLGGADFAFLDSLAQPVAASSGGSAIGSGFAAPPRPTPPPSQAQQQPPMPSFAAFPPMGAPVALARAPTDPWDVLLATGSTSAASAPAPVVGGAAPKATASSDVDLLDAFFSAPVPAATTPAPAATVPAPVVAAATPAIPPRPSVPERSPVPPTGPATASEPLAVATRPPARPSSTSSAMDAKLAQLMDLGFDAQVAADALRHTDGNVEAAVQLILNQAAVASGPGSPPQQSRRAANGGGGGFLGKATSLLNRGKAVLESKVAEVQERGASAVLANVVSQVQGTIEKHVAAANGSGSGSTGHGGRATGYEDYSEEQESWSAYRDEHDRDSHGALSASSSGRAAAAEPVRSPVAAAVPASQQPSLPMGDLLGGASSSPAPAARPSTPSVVAPSTGAARRPLPVTPVAPAAPAVAAPSAPKVRPAPVTCESMAWSESAHHKDQGNDAYKRGQYHEAVTSYTSAIQLLPPNHMALIALHNNRAAAELKSGEYKEAIVDAETVRAIVAYYGGISGDETLADPASGTTVSYADCTKSLLRQAAALEAMEKYRAAKDVFTDVLAHDARNKVAMEGMSRCSRALAKDAEVPPAPAVAATTSSSSSATPATAVPTPPPVVPAHLLFDPLAEAAPTGDGPALPEAKRMDDREVSASAAVQGMRAAERAAEAEADKALAAKDEIDAMVLAWRKGKEANLRTLLSSLDTVLWKELGVPTPALSDLITPQQVKVRYMKVIAKLHPDKLKTDDVRHKMVAQSVFAALNEAWDAFRTQNGL